MDLLNNPNLADPQDLPDELLVLSNPHAGPARDAALAEDIGLLEIKEIRESPEGQSIAIYDLTDLGESYHEMFVNNIIQQ